MRVGHGLFAGFAGYIWVFIGFRGFLMGFRGFLMGSRGLQWVLAGYDGVSWVRPTKNPYAEPII
jgi:hypothetical protein